MFKLMKPEVNSSTHIIVGDRVFLYPDIPAMIVERLSDIIIRLSAFSKHCMSLEAFCNERPKTEISFTDDTGIIDLNKILSFGKVSHDNSLTLLRLEIYNEYIDRILDSLDEPLINAVDVGIHPMYNHLQDFIKNTTTFLNGGKEFPYFEDSTYIDYHDAKDEGDFVFYTDSAFLLEKANRLLRFCIVDIPKTH